MAGETVLSFQDEMEVEEDEWLEWDMWDEEVAEAENFRFQDYEEEEYEYEIVDDVDEEEQDTEEYDSDEHWLRKRKRKRLTREWEKRNALDVLQGKNFKRQTLERMLLIAAGRVADVEQSVSSDEDSSEESGSSAGTGSSDDEKLKLSLFRDDNNEHAQEIDIPERMQISEESTGPPPTDKIVIDKESNWIRNQLRTTEEGRDVNIIKEDIAHFLTFMHVHKYDVPYIAMYKKEYCRSLIKDPELQGDADQKPTLRWHKLLWAILELDRKWIMVQNRKSTLQMYYNKRFEIEQQSICDETHLHLNQKLFDSINKSLKVAESETQIDDVDSKFNLHFPRGNIGELKRPHCSICRKSGLWEVASKFGYSSEEFGLLISLEQMRVDELEDAKETPEEMASSYTCAMFENPQAVLKGARHMAAVEISYEPCVRRHIRNIFMDNAVVSTCPISIDSNDDQLAGIKWLRDKPLTKFDDAQWLLIQKAQEEKLIQAYVKLPASVYDLLISEAHKYYLSDGVSECAQLWNEQRKQIIQEVFDELLLPSMEKEARELLTSRAKKWLLMEYGRRLWDKVSVAPYPKNDRVCKSKLYQKKDHYVAPRVMACCWGPTTTFVILDPFGEVVDVLDATVGVQWKKENKQRIRKFMTDHQPQVVILGAVNIHCTKLKDALYEILFWIIEDNPRDVGLEMDDISVVYADESLPHLYENSSVSSDQLQAQPGIVRRAVGLGRYLQNPLAMVATLCGEAREILSWELTPLQSFLTPDEKYSMVEQVMVDVTNQVGLDVNLAISHEWLFAPLQFISGLGPGKAASLQSSLVRAGSIYTRKDLLTRGSKVFVNAVGFLRVRQSGNAASSSRFIDLLDDTRIHPKSYSLAQALAEDIFTLDSQEEDEDMLHELAIEHMRENPSLLKRLSVDGYAKSKKLEKKKDTLNDIRFELIQGFEDWRKPYVQPNQDEEFYMICGETEDTLAEGKIVQATVTRVQPRRALFVLQCGLKALLKKGDYRDDNPRDIDLTKRLNEGDVITCMIKSIKKTRYQAYLSCKEKDVRNHDLRKKFTKVDPYYHEGHGTNINSESEKEEARKVKKLAVKEHFMPRMIVHPRFHNITADEAMEMLSDKEPGESIVRPSYRGPSHLTLTLKINDGVYAHKDISEGGKENEDITSLGKTLKIGDDVYKDLDEVMDRYVDPLARHLKTTLAAFDFFTVR